MTEKPSVSRRGFLQATGATGAALAAGAFAHPAISGRGQGGQREDQFRDPVLAAAGCRPTPAT